MGTVTAPGIWVFTDITTPYLDYSGTIDIGTTAATAIVLGNSTSATTLSGTVSAPNIASGTTANVIYYNTSTGAYTYGAAPSVTGAWLTSGANTGGSGAYLLGTSDAEGWGMQANAVSFFTVSSGRAIAFTGTSFSAIPTGACTIDAGGVLSLGHSTATTVNVGSAGGLTNTNVQSGNGGIVIGTSGGGTIVMDSSGEITIGANNSNHLVLGNTGTELQIFTNGTVFVTGLSTGGANAGAYTNLPPSGYYLLAASTSTGAVVLVNPT